MKGLERLNNSTFNVPRGLDLNFIALFFIALQIYKISDVDFQNNLNLTKKEKHDILCFRE